MGRWEPDARGRLAEAAFALYAEQGYEQTTAAEIARAAGLTERTFFRHFADKREVLFYGDAAMLDLVAGAIACAPAGASPMDAVGHALDAVAAALEENPGPARIRREIMAANPELRERELGKFAEVAEAMAGALRDRGVAEPAASLAGETGIVAYKVAFARWAGESDRAGGQGVGLRAFLAQALAELRGVLDGIPSRA